MAFIKKHTLEKNSRHECLENFKAIWNSIKAGIVIIGARINLQLQRLKLWRIISREINPAWNIIKNWRQAAILMK